MSTNDKVWVLTREINEYDQDGEYFVKVFKDKPTIGVLAEHLSLGHLSVGEAITYTSHVIDKGGRKGVEYTWYHLREESI